MTPAKIYEILEPQQKPLEHGLKFWDCTGHSGTVGNYECQVFPTLVIFAPVPAQAYMYLPAKAAINIAMRITDNVHRHKLNNFIAAQIYIFANLLLCCGCLRWQCGRSSDQFLLIPEHVPSVWMCVQGSTTE